MDQQQLPREWPPADPRAAPGGAAIASGQPPANGGDNDDLFSDDESPTKSGPTDGTKAAPQDSSEPSYETMGKEIGLPTDVEHIEEVEWANPEDLQPGRYTDKAARPPLDRNSDPCGCFADGTGSICCMDMSCVLFACQEECRSNCEAGDLCGNKRIQRKEWKKLQVFDAGPKGRGLRIMEPVKKGDFICEYVGVAIKKDHLDSLFARYQGERMLYIMALDNDVYIDARKKGGIARYINHSCEPNCMVDRWKVRGVSRACVFAMCDIDAGTELSFDYKWTRKRGRAPTKCHCGAAACRGTLEMPKDVSLEDEELDLKLSGHWKVPITQNPGNEIINRVIKVYFDGDREYYAADVAQYDERTGKHQIIYKSDLSDAWEDLSKLQWMILDREYEQFIISKKSAKTGGTASAPFGTPVGPSVTQQSMAKNFLLVHTYVKEALEVRKMIIRCQNHCRVHVAVVPCDATEIASPEGVEAVKGSADGKLWKLVITGMDPIKARKYLENNVQTIITKTAEQQAKEAARGALGSAGSGIVHSRDVVIPRVVVDDVKRKLHTIRFGAGRNVEVNFTHSESKSKQFAKMTILAETEHDLKSALRNVWAALFKICNDSGNIGYTAMGYIKDSGIYAGELSSKEFNLLFQNAGPSLSQDCSENLRQNPFFSAFENEHKFSIWVQSAFDMGRINSQNRIVGEAGEDVPRKFYIAVLVTEPEKVDVLWGHIRGRVNALKRGVKFLNLGTDRVYFPLLSPSSNTRTNGNAPNNAALGGGDFFGYIKRTSGATVSVDELTRNHLRIDGGDKTNGDDKAEEVDRRIALAEDLIRLQIELLRDHFVRKQSWAFGRDWSLLMDVDPEVKKKDLSASAPSRASPTPGSFSAVRHAADGRARASSCMEIVEISSLLELDREVAAHACIIFYRFLNQLTDASTTSASNVKLREAALACLFLANKAQKIHKWKRLEHVLAAAYKAFYAASKFDEKSEEAKNWEKRVISAESEILTTLQYDIFWPGVDWILASVVESGKIAEPPADNAMELTLSGPVLAAGEAVWLKYGPEYAFVAIAGLLSINMELVLGVLPLDLDKLKKVIQLIVDSIKQNESVAKKYSKAASAQRFQGSQASLLTNVSSVIAKVEQMEASGIQKSSSSTWQQTYDAIGKQSRQSRIFRNVSLSLIQERILPVLDGICAESRCDIYFQQSNHQDAENIVLKGSWRALAIAEFLLQSAVTESLEQAASEQSRSLGLTPRTDSSMDLKASSKSSASFGSSKMAVSPLAPGPSSSTTTTTTTTQPSQSTSHSLPPAENLDTAVESLDKTQAKLKPGVMKMSDIEIGDGWVRSGDGIGEEPRSRGKAAKIGGKTCLPAVASEAQLKTAGLRWWIPPQYGPSLSGSLCDILSIRKPPKSSSETSRMQELAKLASSLDVDGSSTSQGGASFSSLRTHLSNADAIAIRDRSVAVSVQQWPPEKIGQKEKAKKGAMRVGFSPSALQEMQLLQQLHHVIPAPQGHPNFVLPVAIAIEESTREENNDTAGGGGISGLSPTASSSNNDVMSLLTMIKSNPLDERNKRKASTVSHLVFQPTPLILQKVVSRTIKKRGSSGYGKRGSRLVTPSIFACWFHDLLTAMAMCHSNHIVIRNINPDQILVDYSGVAMLSGFNRSIVLHPEDRRRQINPLKSSRGAKEHDEIPTDPFIAPEILLGSSRYTKETDIFSLGCLMAQILLNKPVFSGKDRASKIAAMYKVVGSPGSTNYPDGKHFPHYERTKPEKKYKRGVEKALRYLLKDSGLDVEEDYAGALDLLEQMLHLDPAERITPADALQHEFMIKHKDKIKSAEYRNQFVKDWMSLRDSVLLDKDLSKSGGSSARSPSNRRGLLQKSSGEKETKRKAMLLEATAGDGGDDDDDLYNMDDILDDAKPASKKAKTS